MACFDFLLLIIFVAGHYTLVKYSSKLILGGTLVQHIYVQNTILNGGKPIKETAY